MLRLLTITSAIVLFAAPALGASIEYAVEPFSSIKASNGVVVRVVAGREQQITATAGNQAALDKLQVSVVGGSLIVGFDAGFIGFDLFGGNVVTVDVEMLALDGVSGSAGSYIGVEGISVDAMRLEVALGATLSIEGTCGSAMVSVHEGGTLHAKALECDAVKVDAAMGGMASVFARDKAVIQASTGASVDVYGNPAEYNADEDLGAVIHRIN